VTAAHCVNFDIEFYVYLGIQSVKRKDEDGVKIRVSKVVKHNLFNIGGPYYNDIAILKLEKSAPLNNKIQIACLPRSKSTSFPSYNLNSWIVGWGI
jgi:hypothetical protein